MLSRPLPAADLNASRKDRATERSPRHWPWLVSAVLSAFLLGMLASPWLESKVRGQLPASWAGDEPVDPVRVSNIEARVGNLETHHDIAPAAAPDAATAARIAALEARAGNDGSMEGELLARTESLDREVRRISAELTAGDAQLRDLLLLSVVSRMVESGRPLADTGILLSQRYKTEDAAAVEALLNWSAAPQTPQTLSARLNALSADLSDPAAKPGFWERLKNSLSGLVTVQGESDDADSASTLAAAQQAMREDDLARAIGALKRAPMDPARRQWVSDALLLSSAQDALIRLENRALNVAAKGLAMPASAAIPSQPLNVAPQKDDVAR